MLLEHMHEKFEVNRTKIKGACQSGRKVVTRSSKSDLPLDDLIKNYEVIAVCMYICIFQSAQSIYRHDNEHSLFTRMKISSLGFQ